MTEKKICYYSANPHRMTERDGSSAPACVSGPGGIVGELDRGPVSNRPERDAAQR
jgi:hypothetical protein